MEEEAQDIEGLVHRLVAKDKKRRRNALLYLGLPIAAGLVLIYWTVWQAQTIETKTQEVRRHKDTSQRQWTAIADLKSQLYRTREAAWHVQRAVSNLHRGDYSCAEREYDKAIELDSLNPVVFELKGALFSKIGQAQKAAEMLNKAAEIDSVQEEQRQEFLRVFPAEVGTLKAAQPSDLLSELKPDSQGVIRRKMKARELKRR